MVKRVKLFTFFILIGALLFTGCDVSDIQSTIQDISDAAVADAASGSNGPLFGDVKKKDTSAEKPKKTSSGGSSSSDDGGSGQRGSKRTVLIPKAPGLTTYGNADVLIDASNTSDGYFMLSYNGSSSKVRMLIKTPKGNTYNYLVNKSGDYEAYPFSEGNGTYDIGVYEVISGNEYAVAYQTLIDVSMNDATKAFLYPNMYCNFNDSTKAIATGEKLAENSDDDLGVVRAVYHYVAQNVKYDNAKAANIQDDYKPTVDATLNSNTGICFDYASLMACMLRTQGIPTRIEVGYAGTEYHAWIGVYIDGAGWIDDIITFNGKNWTMMDPTLASYADKSTIKSNWNAGSSYYQLMYKY